MTLKELEAIEKAIHAAAASVVSGSLVVLGQKFSGTPPGWVNDNIRKAIHEALVPALDEGEK